MHPLARPVHLLSSPLAFLDAGVALCRTTAGLYSVVFPRGTRLRPFSAWCVHVLLPSGVRLVGRYHDDGPWSLAVVDDAAEAERMGARVLVGRRMQSNKETL